MSVRELVVLGSGADVPTEERNLHGLLLRWDEHGVLVDPAEGTQRQMIHADVTATSLSAIFISRFHPDACLGLAGICQRISLDRVPQAISVHFPRSGTVFYERLRKASVYHAAARLSPHPMPPSESDPCQPSDGVRTIYEDDRVQFLSARLSHAGMECWGFRLQERDRRTMLADRLRQAGVLGPAIKRLQQDGQVEVGGRRVRLEDVSVPRPGQSVAYLGPTRPCGAALELLRGADVAFCHAPYLEAADAERHGKMTAEEAGRLAEAAGVRCLVLTGFPPAGEVPQKLVDAARKSHPGQVEAAHDGLRVPVSKPRKPGGWRS